MPSPADRFLGLSSEERRSVQIALCHQALQVWNRYYDAHGDLSYVETVCGTKQEVDRSLPEAAIRSVAAGRDIGDVARRYLEPIAAMQDDDLEFPDDIELAYYSIYNLFERHVTGQIKDDWLIVNQALSALGDSADVRAILDSTIDRIGEQGAAGQPLGLSTLLP